MVNHCLENKDQDQDKDKVYVRILQCDLLFGPISFFTDSSLKFNNSFLNFSPRQGLRVVAMVKEWPDDSFLQLFFYQFLTTN